VKSTLTLPAHAPAITRSSAERGAWRSFLAGMGALAVAFGLAIYSGVAAEAGALWTSGAAGLGALALAGWTAVTTVPALARRTPLRWLAYQVDYRVTKQGVIYLAGIFAVSLAALNTGNNLLFLIVGCMLAVILLSGILSRITLTGVEVSLELPEHVFAQRPAPALLELRNLKQTMPSFSLLVVGAKSSHKKKPASTGALLSAAPENVAPDISDSTGSGAVLRQPVYFPYLSRRQSLRQQVELTFPRRGVYRQKSLALRTRFPFGFLEKTRTVPSTAEMVVYPPIEPTDQFYEILPLISGEIETFVKGRGHDLYAIRDHMSGDSARFVDWKATARSGALKIREFAREDERRVLLVLDSFLAPVTQHGSRSVFASLSTASQKFNRAVDLCACLAWHFHELNSAIGFRSGSAEIAVAPSGENVYDVLHALARIEARSPDSGVPATDDALALLYPPLQDGPRVTSGDDFLRQVAADPSIFKIVFTSQPRGSIPTSLWSSSYLIFIDSL
jgi:uncharacterized protein (DUF58 family)